MNTKIAQLIIQELNKYGQNRILNTEKKTEKNPEWFIKYIPELSDCVGFCQNNPYHVYDVFSHTIHALESCTSDDSIVKLAVLFHDIAKPCCYSEDVNGIGHFYRHAMVGANMTNEIMKKLGFEITLHDKMPDVVLYREDKDWIYFVESVTSIGPMDSKRILEIKEMTKDVTAGKIFVTAFLDFKTYKKFAEKLAWETEVWIAEMPEHMIHLNGDKFLGPR